MLNADNLDELEEAYQQTAQDDFDDKSPGDCDEMLSPAFKEGDLTPMDGDYSPTIAAFQERNGIELDPLLLGTFEQTPGEKLGVGVYSTLVEMEQISPHRHMNSNEMISVPELLGLPLMLQKNKTTIQKRKPSSADPDEFGGSESEAAISRIIDRGADNEDELANQNTLRGNIPPPLPILPKQIPDYEAPKCPLDNISFIQLKKFQSFVSQPHDLMGADFEKSKGRRKKVESEQGENAGEQGISSQPVTAMPGAVSLPNVGGQKSMNNGNAPATVTIEVEEIPTFVNGIVFCRDHKALSKLEDSSKNLASPGFFNLRHLIQHENFLDIKNLIKTTTMVSEIERNETLKLKRNKQRVGAAGALKIGNDTEALIHKLDEGSLDKTLLFESRFECGNLFLAQKVNDTEYNLLMQNDINTTGHTQWFYFRVQNTKRGQGVKFNIVNYSKPDSLFNFGMKVAIYSEKKAEEKQTAWHRGCTNISYFANNIRKEPVYLNKTYYTLTFTYDFEYSDDSVYFAYSVPYTYTDLVDDLTAIEVDPLRSQFVSRKTLCKTLAGNNCDYLTVTSRERKDNTSQRKCVIISARVHPGETVGSWMMRGVIKFITDPVNYEARLLRENFIFKIIPMLNPDGVINGNYRCSLAGCDLNRRWKNPSKVIHPTVYYTKKLVKESHEERGVYLFCDLHGHSRKNNIFMYGCHNQKFPEETRIFPYLLSKCSSYFCFEYSRFGNQKSKESTARISLFKDLKNVPNIFTMESTFSGMDYGPQKGVHLSTDDLENMGRDLCRAVLVYSEIYIPTDLPNVQQILSNSSPKNITDIDKKKFKEDLLINGIELEGQLKNLIVEELRGSLLMKNQGDSSSGSESAPSDDNLQPEEIIKIIPVIDKKTKKDLENKKIKQQQMQQQQLLQQKEKEKLLLQQQQAQLTAKKQIKKTVSRQNLQKNKNERSMVKFPVIDFDLRKMDNKDDGKKKPKPIMIDAWTQTERSDYAIIKSRLQHNQLLKQEPGLYQQLMQNAGSTSKKEHHSVELSSTQNNAHTPHQLGSLTRTPGGYNSSTPAGHMSVVMNEQSQKPSTEFANFLAKQGHGPATLESPSKNQYSSQLSNFANSDVNANSLRSPNGKAGSGGANASSLVQYALGARELTNRTNITSNFQAMPDIMQNPSHGSTSLGAAQANMFKNPMPTGALQSIIEQNKYSSGGINGGANNGLNTQTPNIKRQLLGGNHYMSSNGSTSFKSNKNDLSGYAALSSASSQPPITSQSVIQGGQHPQITIEHSNIKKLISNVQMSFKNNSIPLSDLQAQQSPGRTPLIGGGGSTQGLSSHQRNFIKSPQGFATGLGGAAQAAVPGFQSALNGGQKVTNGNDLIFPVLKSKYQSVNSGNLQETVGTNGVYRNSDAVTLSGSAISQALNMMESSINAKYANGSLTRRGLHPSPTKGGSNTKRNSSQQRIVPTQVQAPSSQQSKGAKEGVESSRKNSQIRGGAL